MPHIEILHRYTKAILVSGEYASQKEAAEKSGADLSGADLSGADLSGADLSRANLYSADLSGANLYSADLSGANLLRADLSRADLSGANLPGANLLRAKGVNPYACTPLLMLLDQPDGARLRAYKLINEKSEGHINGGLKYEIGKQVEVTDADIDANKQCGAGINIATLDWCIREWREGYRILVVEFLKEAIACIPTNTDGKFRITKCVPIAEIDLGKVGLMKLDKE